MKIRTMILVALIIAVLIIVGSCATGKKAYVTKENEELYGTWVNTEYNETHIHLPAKFVYHPDGTLAFYWTETSARKTEGTFNIIEKWIDDEGNIWYKVIRNITHPGKATLHTLNKISNSGMILESSFKPSGEFPTILDPNDLRVINYMIHYRQ